MPEKTVSDGEGRCLSIRWSISNGFLLLEETCAKRGIARIERMAIPVEALRAAVAYQVKED